MIVNNDGGAVFMKVFTNKRDFNVNQLMKMGSNIYNMRVLTA